MENSVEKFDPSKLMDGVRDRVKATFVSLIPDDQWELLVKKEVDNFFKQKETNWNNREYKSDFDCLVRDELNKMARQKMTEYLSSPDFMVIWDSNGLPVAQEAVKKLVIENSGAILANTFAGMFSGMLAEFKNQLRNQY